MAAKSAWSIAKPLSAFTEVSNVCFPKVATKLSEKNLLKSSSKVENVPFPFSKLGKDAFTVESEMPGYVKVQRENAVVLDGQLMRLVIRMVKV